MSYTESETYRLVNAVSSKVVQELVTLIKSLEYSTYTPEECFELLQKQGVLHEKEVKKLRVPVVEQTRNTKKSKKNKRV